MLIDLLPDAVDCIVDCRQWRPRSYTEHFSASSIADSALAIEAYSLAPPQYRVPFDALIADLNRLILTAIDRLDTAIATGGEAELRTLAENASASLRALVGQANAIIHGNAQTLAQSQIDELL